MGGEMKNNGGNPQSTLVIIGQNAQATPAGVWVQVTVQNKGKSIIERGDVHLEWFDNVDKNESRILTFNQLKPNQIAVAVTNCNWNPKGKEPYFYFNLYVGKVS
jgi:hypothetical protein